MNDPIERAKTVLRADVPEVDDVRRSRLWANIEAGRRAPPSTLPAWLSFRIVGPVLAIAVMLLGVWLLRDRPTLSPTSPTAPLAKVAPRPDATTTIESGAGTITFSTATFFELPADEPMLLRGEVTLALQEGPPPRAPVVLQTPLARIELVAGRADVRAHDGFVTLAVHEGRARIVSTNGERFVEAGKTVTIEPAEAAATSPAEPRREDSEARPTAKRPVRAVESAPPNDVTDGQNVDRARRMVRRDAPRATEIARAVLDRRPAPAIEARALMVLADAERYANHRAEAAAIYQRVLGLSAGLNFHEEALLRRAELLAALGDDRTALAALDERRAVAGALLPERTALSVQLALRTEGPAAAADRIDAAQTISGVAMMQSRLVVAKALADRDAVRAEKIVDFIIARAGATSIVSDAQALKLQLGKKR